MRRYLTLILMVLSLTVLAGGECEIEDIEFLYPGYGYYYPPPPVVVVDDCGWWCW